MASFIVLVLRGTELNGEFINSRMKYEFMFFYYY